MQRGAQPSGGGTVYDRFWSRVQRLYPESGLPAAIRVACRGEDVTRSTASRWISKAAQRGVPLTGADGDLRREVLIGCLGLYRRRQRPTPAVRGMPAAIVSVPDRRAWSVLGSAAAQAAIVRGIPSWDVKFDETWSDPRGRFPSWLDRLAPGAHPVQSLAPRSPWRRAMQMFSAFPEELRRGLYSEVWNAPPFDAWINAWSVPLFLGYARSGAEYWLPGPVSEDAQAELETILNETHNALVAAITAGDPNHRYLVTLGQNTMTVEVSTPQRVLGLATGPVVRPDSTVVSMVIDPSWIKVTESAVVLPASRHGYPRLVLQNPLGDPHQIPLDL
jgi:hypothetical protein